MSEIIEYSFKRMEQKRNSTRFKDLKVYGNPEIEQELSHNALLYLLNDNPTASVRVIEHHPVEHGVQNDKKLIKETEENKEEIKFKVNNKRTPFNNSDEYFLLKLHSIFNTDRQVSFNDSPAQVTPYMFIGGYKEAKNWQKLKELRITHVVNMAAFWEDRSYNPYPKASGVLAYEAHDAKDSENYDVMQHYPQVRCFIDRARWTGGRVLVHCAMGINRSGAMCCAYLMDGQKMSLLDAAVKLKNARGSVLLNMNFQKQLLGFAKERGFLT